MMTQAKLPFVQAPNGSPVATLIAPNSRDLLPRAPDTTADGSLPQKSKTLKELAELSPCLAAKTIKRLTEGFKDSSGRGYPAATRNDAGCILVQKAPNRQDNGYIQIAPIATTRNRVAKGLPPKKKKPLPQNAHRLAVWAFKSASDRELLLKGHQASHRCHQPTCINPDHIVVETKDENEARKFCRTLGSIIHTEWNGQKLVLPPLGECRCTGAKCIPMIEHRAAVPLD